jgi:hypothetical protein
MKCLVNFMDLDSKDEFAPYLVSKVILVKNADEVFNRRYTGTKKMKLATYLVSQCRARALDFILGCKDFRRLDLRIQRAVEYVVRIEKRF